MKIVIECYCSQEDCKEPQTATIYNDVDGQKIMDVWVAYCKEHTSRTCKCGGYIVRSINVQRE